MRFSTSMDGLGYRSLIKHAENKVRTKTRERDVVSSLYSMELASCYKASFRHDESASGITLNIFEPILRLKYEIYHLLFRF